MQVEKRKQAGKVGQRESSAEHGTENSKKPNEMLALVDDWG